jgi:hypothetical protein
MEKLVRWHQWMDPVRLSRQTGPFIFCCVLILLTPDSHATLSRGHPSKDVRRLVITESLETPSPIDRSAEEVKPPAELPLVEGWKETPQVIQLGTPEKAGTEAVAVGGRNGYLVVAGSVPLRFAAPRGWPAPLPEEVRLAFQVKEEDAFDSVAPEEVTHLTGKSEDGPKPLLEEIIAQALPNQDASKLTAELVIGYLGSMRQESLDTSARFEPAIYSDESVLADASPQ